jgi:hypothetical protein
LFDATRFGWIGSITQTVFVTVTWHTAAVKTLKDAATQEAILGASATSSDSYVLAMLANQLLDTRFKVVHGHAGAAEVDLAVENGEVQGRQGLDHAHLDAAAVDHGQEDQHPGADGDAAAPDLKDADGDRSPRHRRTSA